MKINLTDYIYHSLYFDFDYLKTLENIFNSGYLLTRNSLKTYLTQEEYQQFESEHSPNWNGKDAISVCCNPDDYELITKYNLKKDKHDNAYDDFIKGAITLILDKEILNIFSIKQNSWKMNYELQIMGDIPIKYIKAIGINLSKKIYSSKDLIHFKKILLELNNKLGKYFSKYSDDTWYIMEDLQKYSLDEIFCRWIYPIYKVQYLIESYGLNIPVIDLQYGFQLPDEKKQQKILKEIGHQYKIYMEKKDFHINQRK